MPESTAAAPKKQFLSGILGGGKSYWIVALICALLAVFGALGILQKAAATTTYYVVNDAVPARTQITEDLLFAVQTSEGGAPPNALSVGEIRQMNSGDGAYTLIPLDAGDVLSESNVGPLNRISANLPAGYVAASFEVVAKNAVTGKVRTGDYIDIIAVDDSNGGQGIAKTVLYHVLVLDVTTDPATIAQAATEGQAGAGIEAESSAVRTGIPSLYTVGLSSKDATALALVRDKGLMITLSANDTGASLDASTDGSVLNPGPVPDAGAGTTSGTAPAATDSAAPAAEAPAAEAPAAEAPASGDN